MGIEDFELERLAFEAKFHLPFSSGTRLGALSEALTEAWPGLSVMNAQPGSIAFRQGRKLAIAVELTRSSIVFYYPDLRATLDELPVSFAW